MEGKLNAKPPKEKKTANLVSQLTVLAGIIAGAWIIVTVLNLFR